MTTVKKPTFGKLECVVVVATTFILLGVLTALVAEARPIIAAYLSSESGANAIQKPGSRLTANGNSATTASPASTQLAAREKSTDTQGEAQEPPAPVGASLPVPSRPVLGDAPSWPMNDILGKTILGVAMLLGLTVGAALLFVHCFLALLRRHSVRFGPLVRIEYAGAPPMVVGPFTASTLGVAAGPQDVGLGRTDRFRETPPGGGFSPTAQHFDVGPTIEAERNVKEQQGIRMEQAMLERLFDENLKLNGQIGLAQEAEQKIAE